jgi:hypothetical protein
VRAGSEPARFALTSVAVQWLVVEAVVPIIFLPAFSSEVWPIPNAATFSANISSLFQTAGVLGAVDEKY